MGAFLVGYRLIALDLDGTTLTSQKTVTPRTLAAIRSARERGVHVAIATGRTVHSTLHFSRLTGAPGPSIACNGAAVLDERGDIAIQRPVPAGVAAEILTATQREDLFVECYGADGLYLDRPLRQVRGFVRWLRPARGLAGALLGLASAWHINKIRLVRNLRTWALQTRVPILKVFVHGRPEQLEPLRQELLTRLPGLEITDSGHDNLEITAAQVSKGTALRQLGEWLKIPREEIIAVGDSPNDLAMIEYAGLGVAMGNASPEVKAAAGHVTGTCDQDGVALAIERFILAQGR